VFHEPDLERATLVAAFAGWPDAGEVATSAVRYLRDKLRADLFAELRPEEFYVFTELRPQTTVGDNPWERRITWPANRFYSWKGRDEAPDLVLLLGAEPHLKWSTFVDSVLDLAQGLSVSRVISLGGTLDSVPHTREPMVSGASSDPDLRDVLKFLSVRPSGYEGPTSIHSALLDACNRRRLPDASLWGHGPHYLQSTFNPRVCYALLKRVVAILNLPLDLEDFREVAESFDLQVAEAVAKNPELQQYVKQLEQSMEKALEAADEEMPSPQAIVQDLEEYLRRKGKERKNGEEKQPEE